MGRHFQLERIHKEKEFRMGFGESHTVGSTITGANNGVNNNGNKGRANTMNKKIKHEESG